MPNLSHNILYICDNDDLGGYKKMVSQIKFHDFKILRFIGYYMVISGKSRLSGVYAINLTNIPMAII